MNDYTFHMVDNRGNMQKCKGRGDDMGVAYRNLVFGYRLPRSAGWYCVRVTDGRGFEIAQNFGDES